MFGGWRRRDDSPNWPDYTTGTSRNPFNNDAIRLTSANVPGWKTRIAAGQNVSTTLDGVRGSYSGGYGTASCREGPSSALYECFASGNVLSSQAPTPWTIPTNDLADETDKARTQAIIDFNGDFRNKMTEFNSGTFLGELAETVAGLARPGRALRNGVDDIAQAMKALKRRYGDASKALTKAAAGTWLEWNFGMKPIISDVDDAARAFRAMASGRTFDIIRIKGSGQAESAVEGYVPFAPATPGFLSHSDWRCSTTRKRTVTVDIRGAWRNEGGGQLPLAPLWGAGPRDFLPTAWELLPYSWIVDYFSNFGECLDAWSLRFVNFAWCNITVRECVEMTVRPPQPFFQSGSRQCWANAAPLRMKRWHVTRNPMVSDDWELSLRAKMPGSDSQWLNLSALGVLKTFVQGTK